MNDDRQQRSTIEIVREAEPVSLDHLDELAQGMSGELVKTVVDIGEGIMAIGGMMHADEEATLIDGGSRQTDLWGINLYPQEHGTDDFVEFDSMINLRPGQGNRSRSIEDPATRATILEMVDRLVK